MKAIKKRGVQYFITVVVVSTTLVYAATATKQKYYEEEKPATELMMKGKKGKAKTEKKQATVQPPKKETSPTPPAESDKTPAKVVANSKTGSTMEWYEKLLQKHLDDPAKVAHHSDVVIRYYRKPDDGDKIDQLKELGYYVHERSSNEYFQTYLTNTIYYGDSVKREDILLVAYQLRKAGVKLQAIEHSRYGSNWKSHSIEIGTDTAMVTMPELSLDTIRYIVENNPYIKTKF